MRVELPFRRISLGTGFVDLGEILSPYNRNQQPASWLASAFRVVRFVIK